MNKTEIRNFGVWAQRQLLAAVREQARAYGIDGGTLPRKLQPMEERWRQELMEEIGRKGFDPVMEEAAYLWFHRLVSLRFLEMNGLIPRSRWMLPCEDGAVPPEEQSVCRQSLLERCDALSRDFPQFFQKRADWTSLLFPVNLLHPDGMISRMTARIGEEDWQEAEIMGWLYQFYFSSQHQAVIDTLRGKAIRKEDIPAATQVFTTQWVVQYLLEHSLGRYWLERHPESTLGEKLTFFLPSGERATEPVPEALAPQDLKIMDPCVGAGHFLICAFDLLMEIYRDRGWEDGDAARAILTHNLYGLDIDERTVQLARFALTVKAAQYDPAILREECPLQVMALQEPDPVALEWLGTGKENRFTRELRELCSVFANARECGSILIPPGADYGAIREWLETQPGEMAQRLLPLVRQGEMLTGKYTVVATNPPYMNKYSPELKAYILRHYGPYKGDLFSVFIARCLTLCKEGGYCGLMTPMVWMFIKSYEMLRREILTQKSITTLIHFAYSAFEDATVPLCAFVLNNAPAVRKARFFRLWDFHGGMEVQKQKVLEAIRHPDCGYYFEADQSRFSKIPTSPIAYWLSPKQLDAFDNPTLGTVATPRQGLATGCNERFVRRWYEVSYDTVCLDARTPEEAARSGKKWFPYNKGGEFRKWYGNQEYLVLWENDGQLIRHFRNAQGQLRSRPQNTRYYFRESITWSLISSAAVAFRYQPPGHIFDIAGMSCFADRHLYYLLGLCNSPVAGAALGALAPTINFQVGDIANIPLIVDVGKLPRVEELVRQNIHLSKEDWDAFETSWAFRRHPLLGDTDEGGKTGSLIAHCYGQWEAACDTRFRRLKENEEELNRIFLDIYGLQDELSPVVEDGAVTVRRANLRREIKSLISYGVGCIFGRYSHRIDGLLYAGGDWAAAMEPLRRKSASGPVFLPVEDNIVPLEDGVEEGLASRFFRWVETVYGADTLEENLEFMAGALEGTGTAREVLTHYLCHDFYADHVKAYGNRPVYWLFSSGRKKGFQALIYMHRYQPELPERMYTAYVRRQQAQYRSRLARLEEALSSAASGEKRQLQKQWNRQRAQALELDGFAAKLCRLGAQGISLDPDAGVAVNYARLGDGVKKLTL